MTDIDRPLQRHFPPLPGPYSEGSYGVESPPQKSGVYKFAALLSMCILRMLLLMS